MSNADDWESSDIRAFKYGLDPDVARTGTASVYFKSVVPRPKEFGSIGKTINAAAYVSKKLRMSAWVKTDLPEGASAQLWLRVDGDCKQRPPECFDNMFKHRIKGKSDWCRYEVSVEVPAGSRKIVFGVLLNGTGQVWLDGILLEECGVTTSAG